MSEKNVNADPVIQDLEQRVDLLLNDVEQGRQKKVQCTNAVNTAIEKLYTAIKSEALRKKLKLMSCTLDADAPLNRLILRFQKPAYVTAFGSGLYDISDDTLRITIACGENAHYYASGKNSEDLTTNLIAAFLKMVKMERLLE